MRLLMRAPKSFVLYLSKWSWCQTPRICSKSMSFWRTLPHLSILRQFLEASKPDSLIERSVTNRHSLPQWKLAARSSWSILEHSTPAPIFQSPVPKVCQGPWLTLLWLTSLKYHKVEWFCLISQLCLSKCKFPSIFQKSFSKLSDLPLVFHVI